MRQVVDILKNLRLSRVFTALVLGAGLILTTACNSGTELGARPTNPPVQMGGQNNPHKAGGDGYTNYKMSTDRSVKNASDRANLLHPTNRLVAITNIENPKGLQYTGAQDDQMAGKNTAVDPTMQKKLTDPGQIPAIQQPVVTRTSPGFNAFERAGQSFFRANEFFKDMAENAPKNQPELKIDPAQQ
jgi:hypothetical protein